MNGKLFEERNLGNTVMKTKITVDKCLNQHKSKCHQATKQ